MSRLRNVLLILTIIYISLALLGIFWGPATIPPAHVWRTLAAALGLETAAEVPASEQRVILYLRLPQVLLLGLLGAALACSGAALQAAFENPLIDAGLLGVSSGAALGAALAIHTGLAERFYLSLPACALSGGLGAALLVYFLASATGRPSVYVLLLTGVAVSSLLFAGVMLVLLLARQHHLQELLFWLAGGVAHQTWEHVSLSAPGIAVGVLGLLALHRPLDALLLGEEQALAVGVPVVGTRLGVLALTALATSAATAVGGTIGFVGLLVPHLLRPWTGPRLGPLLASCLVGGAAFLMAGALLVRCLWSWVPLHLGILTAFLGGPAFLLLLTRRERPPS
jgi:iron complex transport system permease protein